MKIIFMGLGLLLIMHDARPDEIEVTENKLRKENTELSELKKEERRLQRKKQRMVRTQDVLKRFELHQQYVKNNFPNFLQEYISLRTNFIESVEKDTQAIQQLRNWLADTLKIAIQEEVTIGELSKLVEQIRDKKQSYRVCLVSDTLLIRTEMEALLSQRIVPLYTDYRTAAIKLSLPKEYTEYKNTVLANTNMLGKRVEQFRVELVATDEVIERPKVCKDLDLLEKLVNLRVLLVELSESIQELSALSNNIEIVTKALENKVAAIQYADNVIRAVREIHQEYLRAITSGHINEAAQLADTIEEFTHIMLANIRTSDFLEDHRRMKLESEVRVTLEAVQSSAERRLSEVYKLRQLAIIRAKALMASMFEITQNTSGTIRWNEWKQIENEIRSQLNIVPFGLYWLPEFTERHQIFAFDMELAAAESKIQAHGF